MHFRPHKLEFDFREIVMGADNRTDTLRADATLPSNRPTLQRIEWFSDRCTFFFIMNHSNEIISKLYVASDRISIRILVFLRWVSLGLHNGDRALRLEQDRGPIAAARVVQGASLKTFYWGKGPNRAIATLFRWDAVVVFDRIPLAGRSARRVSVRCPASIVIDRLSMGIVGQL